MGIFLLAQLKLLNQGKSYEPESAQQFIFYAFFFNAACLYMVRAAPRQAAAAEPSSVLPVERIGLAAE